MKTRMFAGGRIGRAGAVVAAAALILAGCESTDRSPSASAMKHPLLEDIPLPNGFKLVDDQSMARASGRTRIARVKFIGATERAAVMRFFEEYMPRAGFDLRHCGFDRGVYELRFESAGEECTFRVAPEKSKTAIFVELGPLATETASRTPPDELPPDVPAPGEAAQSPPPVGGMP